MTNWISVNDKLPAQHVDVLTITKSKVIDKTSLEHSKFFRYNPHWTNREYITEIEDVTHWMPLPEAPEEFLARCPACGKTPDVGNFFGSEAYNVVCGSSDCTIYIRTKNQATKNEAIEAWNTAFKK